jgi:NADH:ubiquinone oxidoreductase subunit 5 (subunit L)/multisubunit Na+/H+ antiporter MnhA subunit
MFAARKLRILTHGRKKWFSERTLLACCWAGNRLRWAVTIGIAGSLITLVVLFRATKTILWGPAPEACSGPSVKEVPFSLRVTTIILLGVSAPS